MTDKSHSDDGSIMAAVTSALSVTPSATELPFTTTAIMVDGDGTVTFEPPEGDRHGGDISVSPSLKAGIMYPIRTKKITGGTATGIWAFG